MLLSNPCDGERRPLTMSDAIGLAEAMLGLPGFRVVGVQESAAEAVIQVETTGRLVGALAAGFGRSRMSGWSWSTVTFPCSAGPSGWCGRNAGGGVRSVCVRCIRGRDVA